MYHIIITLLSFSIRVLSALISCWVYDHFKKAIEMHHEKKQAFL